jgi:hypothetical protein
MKRYLVIYGTYNSYERGEVNFIGHFDSEDECMSAINEAHEKHCPKYPITACDWYQILDSETMRYIKNTTG